LGIGYHQLEIRNPWPRPDWKQRDEPKPVKESRDHQWLISPWIAPGRVEARNPKWFDRLTILSEVEGQIRIFKFQNKVIASRIKGESNTLSP
jgi:hypothetical protein